MIYLPLSEEEARYLCDIIELWVEEYDSIVRPEIMVDEMLESAEDMLKAYGSAVDDIASGKNIKARLLAMLPQLGSFDE